MKATFKSRMWVEEQLRLLDASGSSNQFNASDLLNAEDENGRTHVQLPALTQGDKYVVSTNAPKDIDVEFRHPYGTEKIYNGNSFTFIVEQGVTYTVAVPTQNLEYFTGYSEENPVFTGGEYIIQIERGAVPSDFKPSDLDASKKEDDKREESENKLITVFDVRIEETKDSVKQTVSETVYGVGEDGEIDENSLLYQLTSLVETTSDRHTIAFDELKKDVDNMDGELQEVRNSFQFNKDGTFTISASNSNASMELTKDALNFKNGDTIVASVSSNELRINRGVFVEKITVGEYSFQTKNGQGVWGYEPRK